MKTSLYGCIIEHTTYDALGDRIKKHNDLVIKSLPEYDAWPPLTRQMFAVTQDSDYSQTPPSYEYYGRTFHFGGSFKSIEREWREWKTKFEQLLTKLVWDEAYVHFKTEYTDVQTFCWRLKHDKWSHYENGELGTITPEHWIYEGDAGWE